MTRFWAFAVTGLLLGCGAAFAQTQPPNSTTLCPVTHGCRPTAQGTRHKTVVPPSTPIVGAIQCPPGTYQIPNTNKCRVR